MNAHGLVRIDEACPHCRTPLFMEVGHAQAREGFACPACDLGMIHVGGAIGRVKAVVGFGLGGFLVLCLFLLFMGLGGAVALAVMAHWGTAYWPIGVAALYLWLFWLVAKWTWGSQRAFFKLLTGSKLIPARYDGQHWRYDVTPMRPKIKRRRGKDIALDGAMSLHEEYTHSGALSTTNKED